MKPVVLFFKSYTDYSQLIKEQASKELTTPKMFGENTKKGKYVKNFR